MSGQREESESTLSDDGRLTGNDSHVHNLHGHNDSHVHDDSHDNSPGHDDEFALRETRDDSQPLRPQICRWQSCGADWSQTGFMDHVYETHLKSSKMLACEWDHCPRRGQSLFSIYYLAGHMRTHIGERPFPCMVPECDRAFTRADSMAKHLKLVHNIDFVRPRRKPKVIPAGRVKFDRIRTLTPTSGGDEVNDLESLKRRLVWAKELKKDLDREFEEIKQHQLDLQIEKEKLFDKILYNELGDEARDIYLMSSQN